MNTRYARMWGRLIRRRRQELGLTQAEFARLFKEPVTQSLVSQWEKGRCAPSLGKTRELARLLDLDDDELARLYEQVPA